MALWRLESNAKCLVFYFHAECPYAQCHYADCHYAECNLLSVIFLSVILQSAKTVQNGTIYKMHLMLSVEI